jgi:hypothetical protein
LSFIKSLDARGSAFGARRMKDDDEAPGVPGFRTWRGVYLFVLGCFALMVIALTIFAHFYA